MIENTYYKDRPAIKVSCDAFSAVFLPEDGAKLASFQTSSGFEFLAQTEGASYKRLGLDTSYVKAECSAFDDMFPTVDLCVINGMEYLDHGEVSRRAHRVEVQEDRVSFACNLERLNVEYRKTVFAKKGALHIHYAIENKNSFNFPYIWLGHMMLRGETGAYVVSDFLPEDDKKIMFGDPGKGPAYVLGEYGSNKEYKYYFTEAKTPLRCGAVYPKSGKKLHVSFNNETVKYLGIWMNPGDLNGMYNLALEPATALYDDPIRAAGAGKDSGIPAGETVCFAMKIEYEEGM